MLYNNQGIIGARYTQRATVLRPVDPNATDPVDPSVAGRWVSRQDDLTGQMIRVWEAVPNLDDPTTVADESATNYEIMCMARGIVDGGIRAAATTEDFGEIYKNIDVINLWVPGKYKISKADRITNIRDAKGNIIWRDEEYEEPGEVRATVFNVNGVIPTLDPFNRVISYFCLLERSEVSG